MKRIVLLVTLVVSGWVQAEEVNPITIKTSLDEVTVFLTGGEIRRSGKAQLKEGRNKLIFTGISTVADDKSIQFLSAQNLNLVSVSTEIDYLHASEKNPRIKNITDSIAVLKNIVTDLQNERAAYAAEKQLLEKNNQIKGEQQNLSVEELRSMATFYRTRMMELNKTITDYDRKIRDSNNLSYRYQNQLIALNYKETIKSNQIIVIVDSETSQTVDLELKYIVSNCGWQANYDLMANNITDKVTLKYKAKVYNNTGNNWNNVVLHLSTSDPNLSASAPELAPWYLNYHTLRQQTTDSYEGNEYLVPQNRAYNKYYQNVRTPQMNQNLDGVGFGNFEQRPAQQQQLDPEANMKFTNIEVSQLSTTFDIKKQYTIPSDAKPYLVEIITHKLDASFSHKAVPKLDQDAFLLANIAGWETLDLVPGPTQVYFSEAFVGQSYLNTSNVSDTLRLSFGRDLKIPVTRKLVKEYSDKKVVGSNRKDTYTYKIIAKNNRSIPVRLNLYDQIPISQDSDISVTVNEISNALYNETTGKLSWELNLNPGESKSFEISFTLKYPKNKTIQVKKYRVISAPSF